MATSKTFGLPADRSRLNGAADWLPDCRLTLFVVMKTESRDLILEMEHGFLMINLQTRFAVFGLLLMAAGCSANNEIDYGKVKLVSVSGTVTLDGQPLAGAVISFDDPATGNFSFARTNSSGSYTLQFDSAVDGVTPGKKTVQISTVRNILGLRGEEGEEAGEASTEGQKAEAKKEQVPECYNKKTKLEVEVTPDKSTFNFDLKSDCSTTGAS